MDTMVALSGAEYRLLRVFLDHPQRVLTRDQLLNLTQGRDADQFDQRQGFYMPERIHALNAAYRLARAGGLAALLAAAAASIAAPAKAQDANGGKTVKLFGRALNWEGSAPRGGNRQGSTKALSLLAD